MPTYPEHYRCRIRGHLGSSSQTWSTGYNLAPFDSITNAYNNSFGLPSEEDYIQNQLQAVARELITGGLISSDAIVDELTCDKIGADGRYINPVSHFVMAADFSGGPIVGGDSTHHVPFQTAIALSLDTDVTRGYAHAGRMFLPVPTAPVSTSGLIQPTDQAAYLGRVQTAMGLASAAPGLLGVTFRAAIISGYPSVGHGSDTTSTGSVRIVTKLRVGRVLDTIRERRSQLLESYIEGPVV
jgi:hypothetical protein